MPKHMAITRSITIDLAQTPPHLHISHELLRRSFITGRNNDLPPSLNAGESLPTWLKNQPPGLPAVRFATNTLHTNFVRGNGFIFVQYTLMSKPSQAIPLDGETGQVLDGIYTALVLSPGPARIRRLSIRQGELHAGPPPEMALSGPQIVQNGHNLSQAVAVRLPPQGPTRGDEINYSPDARASFTAFGVTAQNSLLVASTFAGQAQVDPLQADVTVFHSEPGDGLTLSEMADLMIELGAQNAIIGGGSGDTQQYIAGQGTWCALPRCQPDRQQVSVPTRLRGLGAILWI
jgi:hypothetical protein